MAMFSRFPIQTACVGATPPLDPPQGLLWVDISTPVPTLRIYANNSWHSLASLAASFPFVVSYIEPIEKVRGTMWIDTSKNPPEVKVWDGSDWKQIVVDLTVIDGGTL